MVGGRGAGMGAVRGRAVMRGGAPGRAQGEGQRKRGEGWGPGWTQEEAGLGDPHSCSLGIQLHKRQNGETVRIVETVRWGVNAHGH